MEQIKGNVLVTGAAKRIGRSLALALARDGWATAIHYRNAEEEAESLVDEIKTFGGNACAVQADLSQEVSTSTLVSASAATLGGPITALINNASVFEHDTWDSVNKASWNNHLDVNLRAPFFLAQAMAKALPDGRFGNIINIIDQRVWKLTPDYLSYTLSKSALWTLTQTLAQALAPQIRVNAVGPGPVLKSIHQDKDSFERQSQALLLGKAASLGDVTKAVKFLLDTPSITGQMIAVDSGQHLAWKTPDAYGVD